MQSFSDVLPPMMHYTPRMHYITSSASQCGKQTYYVPAKGCLIHKLIDELLNSWMDLRKKILRCDLWKMNYILY